MSKQFYATNLAETLTILAARAILFLKQINIKRINPAKTKHTTAKIVLAVLSWRIEIEPAAPVASAVRTYAPNPTKAAIVKKTSK